MSGTNFLGLPIEGDIAHGSTRVEQRPIEELTAIIEKVFEIPGVDGIYWRQYTPYFNDGEPCEFSAGEAALHFEGTKELTEDDEDFEDYEGDYVQGFFGEYSDELDQHFGPRERSHGYHSFIYPPSTNKEAWETFDALDKAINGGEFENVLLDTFGDHAEIKVWKGKKIEIEFYEHD